LQSRETSASTRKPDDDPRDGALTKGLVNSHDRPRISPTPPMIFRLGQSSLNFSYGAK
jgi:hypothetical protein